MKTEREIMELIAVIYRDIGGDPGELVSIRPSHGGWLNALKFEVVRADQATTSISRVDIDCANRRGLTKALKSFAHPRAFDGSAPRIPPPSPERRQWRGRTREAKAEIPSGQAPESTRLYTNPQGAARLALLCGSCFVERQHVVTIDDQSSTSLVVVARCEACGTSIRLALTGGSKPGITIADRLKRAISLSGSTLDRAPGPC